MKGSQEEKLSLTWPSFYTLLTASPVAAWNLFSLSANTSLTPCLSLRSLAFLADLALFLRSLFYLSLKGYSFFSPFEGAYC